MKSLVAEDDDICRRILREILVQLGTCDEVVNGREAVDAFKKALAKNQPYDLICLDVVMPEKDGHQALKEIRSQEHERGVPAEATAKIIMTTALDDPKTIITSFKERCEDYLIKPVDRQKFLNSLKKLGLIK